MAAKVNKQVVIGLVVGIVCVVAAVVFLMTFVFKSGADLATRGDKLMEQGKFEEASLAFSKAVNKEPNKVDYQRKWLEALSQLQPTSLQAYSDRYQQWYRVQGNIASTLRNDVAAHKAVLEMTLREIRMMPPDKTGGSWQSFESSTSDLANRLAKDDPTKGDAIKRYRGIATAAKAILGLEVSEEDRARAKADLMLALQPGSTDGLAAFYYAELMRTTADKEARTNNPERSALLLTEARTVIGEFAAKNPTSSLARMASVQLANAEMIASVRVNPTLMPSYLESLKPSIEQLLMTLESEDPAKVDDMVAVSIIDNAVRNKAENAVARGLAVYDRLLAARPNQPFLMMMKGNFLALSGKNAEAAEHFKMIMGLPNLPVSQEGILLFSVRDQAALARAEALVTQAEQVINDPAKTPAEREAALAAAKSSRDEVKGRATIDEKFKVLLDARIALVTRDTAEARKLLNQYNQMTSNQDPRSLVMLAQVLRSQGLDGEARKLLMQAIDLGINNIEVVRMLVALELKGNNLTNARRYIELGLNMVPGDQALLQAKEQLLRFEKPEQSSDPFVRALGVAQAAVSQSPPDRPRAIDALRQASTLASKGEDFVAVVQLMNRLDRTEALAVAKKGAEMFPDNPQLKSMLTSLSVENPYETLVEQIKNSKDLTEIQKLLQQYVLATNFGKFDEANTLLNQAAAIEPQHPVVVAGLFERFLSKYERERDAESLAKAQELSRLAGEKNLDKVEGRIYQARLLGVQGKAQEGIPLLERAAELDPLNPLTWRYLASLYVATGDLGRGLKAIERSLQIKPDEIASIVVRLRILTGMERITEARDTARDAARLGIQDPVFVHLWLILEFRAGDKDLALERRGRILQSQPENTENSLAYARDLLTVGRIEDASNVMVGLEGRSGVEPTLSMLRAAVRGARGENEAALAAFETLIEDIAKNDKIAKENVQVAQEAAALEIADLLATVGRGDLVIELLNRCRKYQTPERARVDRMLGDLHFGRGSWEEARLAYARARETTTDTEKLLLKRIIECHMKAREFDQARKMLDAEGGDRSDDVQVLLLASQLEVARGDRAKALQILDRAVEKAPNNSLPYRQRGVERLNDTRTVEDAITDFKQAIGISDREPELYILLARAQIKHGFPAAAVDTLQNGLRLLPDEENLRFEQVQLLYSLGRTKEAFDALEAARAKQPTNLRWPLLQGILHQRAGDQASAISLYEQGWRANKSPEVGKALADALMALFDTGLTKTPPTRDEGLLNRAKAVVDSPEFKADTLPASRVTRATLALRQNRRDDAIGDLRAIIEKKMLNLGDQQQGSFLLDDLRRAYAGDMNKVLELLEAIRPSDGWAEMFHLLLARSMMNNRENKALRERGFAELSTLLKSKDKVIVVGAASTRGGNNFLDNKFEDAVADFQAGLEVDPDNAELNNNMAYVLSKGLGRHAEALPRVLKASEKDPNNPNILDTLGVIYMNTGDLVRAESTLQRAIANAPDAVTRTMPTLHMIEVLLKKGDKMGAENLMRQLEGMMQTDPRIKPNYEKDIDELRKRMKAAP